MSNLTFSERTIIGATYHLTWNHLVCYMCSENWPSEIKGRRIPLLGFVSNYSTCHRPDWNERISDDRQDAFERNSLRYSRLDDEYGGQPQRTGRCPNCNSIVQSDEICPCGG